MTPKLTNAAQDLLSKLGFEHSQLELSRGEVGAANQVSTGTAHPTQHKVFMELLSRLKLQQQVRARQEAAATAPPTPAATAVKFPKEKSTGEKNPRRGFQYAPGLFEDYHASLSSSKPWTNLELVREAGTDSEFCVVRKAYQRWCVRSGVQPLSHPSAPKSSLEAQGRPAPKKASKK